MGGDRDLLLSTEQYMESPGADVPEDVGRSSALQDDSLQRRHPHGEPLLLARHSAWKLVGHRHQLSDGRKLQAATVFRGGGQVELPVLVRNQKWARLSSRGPVLFFPLSLRFRLSGQPRAAVPTQPGVFP